LPPAPPCGFSFNCKNNAKKTITQVKTFTACNDKCQSETSFHCNLWTLTKNFVCTLRQYCRYKYDPNAVTGRRGCPTSPKDQIPDVESPALGTGGQDVCSDSVTLPNALNTIDLYTSTGTDQVCSGIKFNKEGVAGVKCGTETSIDQNIKTQASGPGQPKSSQNCISDIKGKLEGASTNRAVQFLEFTTSQQDSKSCGFAGGDTKLQTLTPSSAQFGKCCLTNYINTALTTQQNLA